MTDEGAVWLAMIVVAGLWVVMSISVGWAASVRGRAMGKWFALSLALSPVFVLLLLVAAGPLTETERAKPGVTGVGLL